MTLFHLFCGRGNHGFFPAFQSCVRAAISLITVGKVPSQLPSRLPHRTLAAHGFSAPFAFPSPAAARALRGRSQGFLCLCTGRGGSPLALHPAPQARLACLSCGAGTVGVIYDRICRIQKTTQVWSVLAPAPLPAILGGAQGSICPATRWKSPQCFRVENPTFWVLMEDKTLLPS